MKPVFKNKRHAAEEYLQGILNSERVMLCKAITLVESRRDSEFTIPAEVMGVPILFCRVLI